MQHSGTIQATSLSEPTASSLVDSFGRHISYVRFSVTDRCDLRCRYCMAESMEFMPNSELLTADEISSLTDILISRGVRKIRLTGGEPLVRRDVGSIVRKLGDKIGSGLEELTLTTNGTLLPRYSKLLFSAGIRRINVSLDSLDPERYRSITRRGELEKALAGVRAAADAGLRIKINMVALAGFNDDEIEPMLDWCIASGHDLTLIETMPLGVVEERRSDRYLPLDAVKTKLGERYGLVPSTTWTGGPARYFNVGDSSVRLGFITPLTQNFCSGCNRIRITANGTVFGCLGHDQKVDLREALREGGPMTVNRLLDELLRGKPQAHQFDIDAPVPAVSRHMSLTGG